MNLRSLGALHAFPSAEGTEGLWRPPVDLYETPTAVVVEIEIPGASSGAIRIVADSHTLLVEGSRETRAAGSSDGRFLCIERASGPFRRLLKLPVRVDRDRAVARYRDGILTITLPKAR